MTPGTAPSPPLRRVRNNTRSVGGTSGALHSAIEPSSTALPARPVFLRAPQRVQRDNQERRGHRFLEGTLRQRAAPMQPKPRVTSSCSRSQQFDLEADFSITPNPAPATAAQVIAAHPCASRSADSPTMWALTILSVDCSPLRRSAARSARSCCDTLARTVSRFLLRETLSGCGAGVRTAGGRRDGVRAQPLRELKRPTVGAPCASPPGRRPGGGWGDRCPHC